MPAELAADHRLTSYATLARQRGYVKAMHALAAERQPGPVRVYVSAPPLLRNRPSWGERLNSVRSSLPNDVVLLDYETAWPEGANYPDDWYDLVPRLDGLIVIATQKRPGGRVYQLQSAARNEMRTVVATGKPVLLHTPRGLVPVVDCHPNRTGPPEKPRLKLTIPEDWDHKNPGPTLSAAFHALQPVDQDAQLPVQRPSHLEQPFTVASQ